MKKSKPIGRPPLYKTAKELQVKIDEYFNKGYGKRKVVIGPSSNRETIEIPVVTITGLVSYCGFANRQSFLDYEEKPEFTCTIKKARNRIEQVYEELLQSGLGAGAIFALKNFGWVDKQELEHSGEVKFTQMPAVKIDGKPLEVDIG